MCARRRNAFSARRSRTIESLPPEKSSTGRSSSAATSRMMWTDSASSSRSWDSVGAEISISAGVHDSLASLRPMIFRQITHDDLGCASYLVGDEKAGIAAVVDPRFEVEDYLELARYMGVRIEHVFETHNHADHVSGHGRLAAATGATIHIHRDRGARRTSTSRSTTATSGSSAACGSARCTRPATGPSTPRSR